jgi:hypothetical protein
MDLYTYFNNRRAQFEEASNAIGENEGSASLHSSGFRASDIVTSAPEGEERCLEATWEELEVDEEEQIKKAHKRFLALKVKGGAVFK